MAKKASKPAKASKQDSLDKLYKDATVLKGAFMNRDLNRVSQMVVTTFPQDFKNISKTGVHMTWGDWGSINDDIGELIIAGLQHDSRGLDQALHDLEITIKHIRDHG